MNLLKALLSVLIVVVVAGCDSPQSTVTNLEKEIAAFKVAPDDTKQAQIEQSFAKLDAQIATLNSKGQGLKAAEFERQAATLRSDYQTAKVARAIQDAKNAFQGVSDAVKDGVKSIGDAFKNSGTTNP